MYKEVGEKPVEDDAFAKKLMALAAEEGHVDFLYSGYSLEGNIGATIANVKDGVIFITILYSMMMQYPHVFKMFLGVLIQMAVESPRASQAIMGEGDKEKEEPNDFNMDDFCAKQQP